ESVELGQGGSGEPAPDVAQGAEAAAPREIYGVHRGAIATRRRFVAERRDLRRGRVNVREELDLIDAELPLRCPQGTVGAVDALDLAGERRLTGQRTLERYEKLHGCVSSCPCGQARAALEGAGREPAGEAGRALAPSPGSHAARGVDPTLRRLRRVEASGLHPVGDSGPGLHLGALPPAALPGALR